LRLVCNNVVSQYKAVKEGTSTYRSFLRSQRPTTLEPSLLILKLSSLFLKRILHLLVTRVQLLFRLLKLGLLFLNLLLENHLHLGLHLSELSLVQDAFFLEPGCRAEIEGNDVSSMLLGEEDGLLDLLEDRGVLSNTHAQELLGSPVLIENIVGVLAKFLHIGADEHLAKLDEITVVLIVDLNNTPWVCTSADLTTVRGFNDLVGADDGKRDLAGNLLSFCKCLLILIVVSGSLEDVDVMVGNIRKNL